MENEQSNPYQAPDAELNPGNAEGAEYYYTGPSSRPTGEGLEWISQGYAMFKLHPGAWVATIVVGALVLMLLNFIPIIGDLFSFLTTYVWTGGLMLGCQAVADGKKFDVKYLFEGFRQPLLKLVGLSVIVTLVSVLVMFVVMGEMFVSLMMASEDPAAFGSNMDMMGLMLSILIAMALLIPVIMSAWFAPALIVLQNMSIIEAMKASFAGCIKNVLPFLIYGIVMLALYIVGAIPLLLGLLVVLPIAIASMYSSYRAIYLSKQEEQPLEG